jgi:2-C-methyl-D-erythritol 4-phosphate cytidylyltransferase
MSASKFYALIPAAGSGMRVGGDLPKQYQTLAGRPMLSHCVDTFVQCARVDHVFVVVTPHDEHAARLPEPHWANKVTILYCGGTARDATVTNGLNALFGLAAEDDWILVHDAARPGLTVELLERLIDAMDEEDVGGLLGLPIPDTVKRESVDHEGKVARTVARDGLWLAQTPQMFRYGTLRRALEHAREWGITITDEASAIEALGAYPRLVQGSARNMKVTYPEDFATLETWLKP